MSDLFNRIISNPVMIVLLVLSVLTGIKQILNAIIRFCEEAEMSPGPTPRYVRAIRNIVWFVEKVLEYLTANDGQTDSK